MAAAVANAPFVQQASAGMRDLWSAFSTSEARYFDEERYSEAELRRLLSDSLTDKKIDAMKRILAAVSNGNDASNLFPDVVKNVSFQSLELKKLIYIYLVQYAENNRDLALLSINSFQKDLMDRSQLVRASALRAMASIKVIEVIQIVMVSVKTASNDNSPYVRKTAAQCMTKVYAVDPDQFFELRGLLLKLMNDHEVQVVGSAVMAFHHICVVNPPQAGCHQALAHSSADGGAVLEPDAVIRLQLVLLHPHFRRLCQDILLMDAWAQQCCVDVLLRYCRLFFARPDHRAEAEAEGAEAGSPPEANSQDLASFLRALKMLLSSSSKGVTLSAAAALCYLAPAEELGTVTMPLLRCLRQAPAEGVQALLLSLMPLVQARPDLIRSSIREFFVQSFDFPAVKSLKLKIMVGLVDDTNVQMVLRELQAYVCWQSHPDFVAIAVQSIAKVALKISSVADSCLRGLVKMLDSKCDVLSCEAVVALRALLQRRHQNSDSGLGAVLPHLAHYLEDLAAPTARASVVWIIGQYQREAPKLAPDVVRRLTKSFASERQEVKQQVLMLSIKVWAFHALNAAGQAPVGKDSDNGTASKPGLPPAESARILPRLEALVDHIVSLASFDAAWDVRDTARSLKQLKNATKAGLSGDNNTMNELGLWYCRACACGEVAVPANDGNIAAGENSGTKNDVDVEGTANKRFEPTWKLGSLAQALDFPLDTYRSVPAWAKENSPDELRNVAKVEQPAAATAPKSFSSSNVGNIQHMETRVQNPSNISNMPVISSLEDLDLFYTQDSSSSTATATAKGVGKQRPPPSAPPEPVTLEQMRLGGPPAAPVAPVGTAVFGEDSESEEEEDDEDDLDWKYCMQASQPAGPAAGSTAPAAGASPPAADPPVPSVGSAAPSTEDTAAPAADSAAAPTDTAAPASDNASALGQPPSTSSPPIAADEAAAEAVLSAPPAAVDQPPVEEAGPQEELPSEEAPAPALEEAAAPVAFEPPPRSVEASEASPELPQSPADAPATPVPPQPTE